MKAKGGRDEISKRRRGQKLNPRKIAVASEVALGVMAADPQPIFGGLERQVDVLVRLQLNDREPAGARNPEDVDDAGAAAGCGKHLRIDKSRIKSSVDPRDLLAHQRFEPALGLGAIERMLRVGGQRIAVKLEIAEELFQPGLRADRKSVV